MSLPQTAPQINYKGNFPGPKDPLAPCKDCANIGCDCCANCGGVNNRAEGAQYWATAIGMDWIFEACKPEEKEAEEDEVLSDYGV